VSELAAQRLDRARQVRGHGAGGDTNRSGGLRGVEIKEQPAGDDLALPQREPEWLCMAASGDS
jgi:hypothetical protein